MEREKCYREIKRKYAFLSLNSEKYGTERTYVPTRARHFAVITLPLYGDTHLYRSAANGETLQLGCIQAKAARKSIVEIPNRLNRGELSPSFSPSEWERKRRERSAIVLVKRKREWHCSGLSF